MLRDEEEKLALAERLYELFNIVISCPSCGEKTPGGTFRKNVAGKANLLGERYRRYVCQRSSRTGNSHCGKTLSTAALIDVCCMCEEVGKERVREVQEELEQFRGMYID